MPKIENPHWVDCACLKCNHPDGKLMVISYTNNTKRMEIQCPKCGHWKVFRKWEKGLVTTKLTQVI